MTRATARTLPIGTKQRRSSLASLRPAPAKHGVTHGASGMDGEETREHAHQPAPWTGALPKAARTERPAPEIGAELPTEPAGTVLSVADPIMEGKSGWQATGDFQVARVPEAAEASAGPVAAPL